MSGAEITTRHMFFLLIVCLLSVTGHDALSVFVSSGQLFARLLCIPSTAVNGFRLLSFVHPCPLSVRTIPRIIFFRGLNSQDFNKVVGEPSSIGVISHKNLAPAVLEYALPEA